MAEQAKTASEAVREYFKDELASGQLSEADLARLQEIAERGRADVEAWANDAGVTLKAEAHDFIDGLKDHAEALKEANADGVISGREAVEHGMPVVHEAIDLVQTVDDEVGDGVHLILDVGRDVLEARREMDGADQAKIDETLQKVEEARADFDAFKDWRTEQRDQAHDVLDAKAGEVEQVDDIRDLPHQPTEDSDADLPIAEA